MLVKIEIYSSILMSYTGKGRFGTFSNRNYIYGSKRNLAELGF